MPASEMLDEIYCDPEGIPVNVSNVVVMGTGNRWTPWSCADDRYSDPCAGTGYQPEKCHSFYMRTCAEDL